VEVASRSDAEARQAQSLTVDIEVTELADSFALALTMESAHGRAERNMELASCDDVRRAAAVLVATALTHDLAAPAEGDEDRVENQSLEPWSLRLGALADLGSLPGASGGALLGLGYTPLHRAQVWLDLRYLAPRETEPDSDELSARIDLFAAALVGSYTWAYGAFSIGPSLELELGALRGRVTGRRADGSRNAAWLSGFAGATSGYGLGRVTLGFSVLIGAPLSRPAFIWGDDEGGYRTGAIAVRGQLGISVRLGTKKNAETGQ
jgi:hypothetical protein